jgi:hypothetical protein
MHGYEMLKFNGLAVVIYNLFVCAHRRFQLLEQDLHDYSLHLTLINCNSSDIIRSKLCLTASQ